MKWLTRRAMCAAAWLALASLCWAGSVGAFATLKLSAQTDVVSYRDTSATTQFTQIARLREVIRGDFGGEPSSAAVTAWTQSLSAQVSAENTGGSASVDVIWFDGSVSSIWDLPVKSGAMPGAGETTGCALDYRTALSLFGSTDIVGLPVTVGGAELAVRGVFALPEGIGAYGADPGRGLVFAPAAAGGDDLRVTAYEFHVPAGGAVEAGDLTRGFFSLSGLRAPGTAIRRAEERALLRLLVQLPCILLMLFAAFELVRAGYGLARAGIRHSREALSDMTLPVSVGWTVLGICGAGVAVLAGALAFVLTVTPVSLYIPPAYLPTQWSDLSFWPELVRSLGDAAAKDALTVAFRPDMARGAVMSWAAWLGVGAVAALLPARRALGQAVSRGRLPHRFVLCALAVTASPPLCVALVRALGWTPDVIAGMVSLPLMFFAAYALLRTYPPALTLPIRSFRYARARALRPAEKPADAPAPSADE